MVGKSCSSNVTQIGAQILSLQFSRFVILDKLINFFQTEIFQLKKMWITECILLGCYKDKVR